MSKYPTLHYEPPILTPIGNLNDLAEHVCARADVEDHACVTAAELSRQGHDVELVVVLRDGKMIDVKVRTKPPA